MLQIIFIDYNKKSCDIIASKQSCQVLLGWKGAFVGKRRKKVWQAAPSCLVWTV